LHVPTGITRAVKQASSAARDERMLEGVNEG